MKRAAETENLVQDILSLRDLIDGPLSEEKFLDSEALSVNATPSLEECSLYVYRHAVFAAVNETLEELSQAPLRETSVSTRLKALKNGLVGASSTAVPASPSAAEVLKSLNENGVKLSHTLLDSSGTTELSAAEDLGNLVRIIWGRLAPAWAEPATSKLVKASFAQEPNDIIDDKDEASRHEEQLRSARLLFWKWRENEILTDAELHGALWEALRAAVSPPYASTGPLTPPAPPINPRAGTPGALCPSEQQPPASLTAAAELGWPVASEASQPHADDEGAVHEHRERIHFDDWIHLLDELEASGFAKEKLATFRSSRLFLGLQLDRYGRASIVSIYRLVASLTQLLHTRVALALLDDGSGRLAEPALETFIQELIPKLDQLREQPHLQPEHSFLPFYLAHCVRKFMLLLDPHRKGSISLESLLLSQELAALFALGADRPPSREEDESNWFSLSTAIRIYRQFLVLDDDHDGMLSPSELLLYGDSLHAFTPAFVDRLFEVIHTYDGRMDYKGYLDFVVACENRSHPASITYFFRALDLSSSGFIDVFALNYFVRDIVQGLLDAGNDPPMLETIIDELIDLCKSKPRKAGVLPLPPPDPTQLPKISLRELIASGAGPIVIACLTDTQGFWNWDNRESLIEYRDDDRYAREVEASARSVWLLFPCAARTVSVARAPDGKGAEAERSTQAELRKLSSTRTMRALLRRVASQHGGGRGDADKSPAAETHATLPQLASDRANERRAYLEEGESSDNDQALSGSGTAAVPSALTEEDIDSTHLKERPQSYRRKHFSVETGAASAPSSSSSGGAILKSSTAPWASPANSQSGGSASGVPGHPHQNATPASFLRMMPPSPPATQISSGSLISESGVSMSSERGPTTVTCNGLDVDDILLWLQTAAFKKRPASSTMGGFLPSSETLTRRHAHQAQIVAEVRAIGAKTRAASDTTLTTAIDPMGA